MIPLLIIVILLLHSFELNLKQSKSTFTSGINVEIEFCTTTTLANQSMRSWSCFIRSAHRKIAATLSGMPLQGLLGNQLDYVSLQKRSSLSFSNVSKANKTKEKFGAPTHLRLFSQKLHRLEIFRLDWIPCLINISGRVDNQSLPFFFFLSLRLFFFVCVFFFCFCFCFISSS